MKKNDPPKIIKNLVTFFKYWDNPYKESGKYKSIQVFQLAIYDVSFIFTFKWEVNKNDLKEASDYTGIEIINNTLSLSLSEYNIELYAKP